MSVKLLEHMRDELISCGVVQNTPEFCRAWLGRSEGYIRTLRNHGTGPSVETLAPTFPKLPAVWREDRLNPTAGQAFLALRGV